ncbi:efflux RND transporter periplasmic adaptor subunit [Pontibacter sp. BT310]|uniref:Efflux RND transporter periplasmic adaptor subunit n=1 Tax=Pontibacter populi TaxID=890055 RepID=A0ABS6X7H0_9BACT|nr:MULTISPECIES: efflux RND transporter periplasmic adaptor subunit [Pontibacter]MBJ6116585.1 efflux RND transporter periplasmic adaptor subunit [Pontibacter sp. BT310]MBR0569009.1 efflux RND transporter periplasmic adaptor subunit [Microvirga sp. STS03]MBW3363438.1 efflux RND transporter periplasmic adaptor subunit [Pontibacter populi]
MKKVIYILIALVVLAAVGYKLMSNKEQMAANAAVAEIKSDAIPVAVTEVKTEKLDKSFTAQGNFAPIQSLTLLSETTGQVQRVLKRKGDKVKAGELLLQVESNTMSADLATAQTNAEKAKRDLERFENLAAGDAITQRQLEDARLAAKSTQAQLVAARQRLTKTRITAPINGEINEIYVEVGSYLGMSTKLYDIVNVDKLKLKVKASESEVLLINKGDKVTVKANAGAGQEYEGVVTAIAAQADPTLKFDVEVEVKNAANNNLRAGMYGTAYFKVDDQRDAMLLPRQAIVGSIQNPSVYVVKDGVANMRKVKVGVVTQDKVEILEGVQPGDQVVQSGQINLREGIKVTLLK